MIFKNFWNAYLSILKKVKHKTYPMRSRLGLVRNASPISEHKFTEYDILIFGPLSPSGLTTQVNQIIEQCNFHNLTFRIHYYTKHLFPHPAKKYWVNKGEIGKPKLIIMLERFPSYMTKHCLTTPTIYYLNLDWFSNESLTNARLFADGLIFPVDFKFDHLKNKFFDNLACKQLKWPSVIPIEKEKSPVEGDDTINVLYVGNDYSAKSRKSPKEVVDAILKNKNAKLRFFLKFRSKVPKEIKQKLIDCPQVVYLKDHYTSVKEVESLYSKAHINLIPNESEGNGLSIIESYAKGVIPAVLNGRPMTDNVCQNSGYLIGATINKVKGCGFNYKTTTESILNLFDQIDHTDINKKLEVVKKSIIPKLESRSNDFNSFFTEISEFIKSDKPIEMIRRACQVTSLKMFILDPNNEHQPSEIESLKSSLENIFQIHVEIRILAGGQTNTHSNVKGIKNENAPKFNNSFFTLNRVLEQLELDKSSPNSPDFMIILNQNFLKDTGVNPLLEMISFIGDKSLMKKSRFLYHFSDQPTEILSPENLKVLCGKTSSFVYNCKEMVVHKITFSEEFFNDGETEAPIDLAPLMNILTCYY